MITCLVFVTPTGSKFHESRDCVCFVQQWIPTQYLAHNGVNTYLLLNEWTNKWLGIRAFLTLEIHMKENGGAELSILFYNWDDIINR